MTVVACLPCHGSPVRKDVNEPIRALQEGSTKELDHEHDISHAFEEIGCGREVSIPESVTYESGEYRFMPSDTVDIMDDKSIKIRRVGRRKDGQQKNGKQKKGDGGNRYGRKSEGRRSRRPSQGNGSSGMEGSGEGSGNGDDSSDEDDDDCDDDGEDEQDEDEEEEEEEEEDEMEEEIEEDTDNVSTIVEDDMEETTNGSIDSQPLQRSLELKRLEFENPGPKVASGTFDLQSNGSDMKDGSEGNGDSTIESIVVPAVSGTPVTLSGVIWKETVGGVLVVNLKWRNKMYCGTLIDHSRHGWATPRNLDEVTEPEMSNSKRGKGRKGKHNGSTYTGNPLSPKMTGNGKRGPRFHRNKGKHGKDSFVRPRTKRGLGSDNNEEGTRTRRRSCTVKTSVSPSPSPTPLIECPERNCNKKYKHINGLRYHQAHAHLENIGDPDEKESDDEEETKSGDIKEPLSARSKSPSSDDVKPLSHRKAKNQKNNSSNSNKSSENVTPEESAENEQKSEAKEDGGKFDVTNIKVEPDEPVKTEEKTESSSPNILQEAAKIIFDEPTVSDSQITCNTDVTPPGIFARMISQHMMVSSHPEEYKYDPYDSMAENTSGSTEKIGNNLDVSEMDVTVKEEVIEEGNAGMAKVSCKDQTEEVLKPENTDVRLGSEKSREVNVENVASAQATDKAKLPANKQLKSANNNRKCTSADGSTVTKETSPMKTSAAEIRSLPGYQHFRLPSTGNCGSYISQSSDEKAAKTLALDSRLLETKDLQKSVSGLIWDSGGTPKRQTNFEKQKSMVWKMQGAPSTTSASFQLTCENKNSLIRPYISSSKKVASTTWVPEVHPAVMQKATGGGVPGQEVLPEKPVLIRETNDRVKTAEEPSEQEEEGDKTKSDLGKADEDRTKACFAGKPARAVGVAHPFNAEKSEDPVKVLYSKSSSPKVSRDLSKSDTTEVKKVRVEKTLEVPVGEVIPLAKTSRSVVTSEPREAVIVGNDGSENYTGMRASLPGKRLAQPVDTELAQTDIAGHSAYISSVAERPLPWQSAGSYSPPRDGNTRILKDPGTRYNARETGSSPLGNTSRRSPVREIDRSSSFRGVPGAYMGMDTGRRTPEDSAKRLLQKISEKRLPFGNFDERSPQREKNTGIHFKDSGSPDKDTSGHLSRKGTGETMTYRDSHRRSPSGEKSNGPVRRDYDRSPLRDSSYAGRRSPARERLQRSPDRETVHRASYRTSTSPSVTETTRRSPYRDPTRVKQPREGEDLPQRRDERSSESEQRGDSSKGYTSKSETRVIREPAEGLESQRMPSENKQFPRLSEEEAMMLNLRPPFFPYPTPQDSVTREAMENYMMYLGRLPIPATLDPRLLQAYSMLPTAQIPLLLQPPKDAILSKEERTKDVSDERRTKSSVSKSESQRTRGLPFSESSDLEIVTGKRHLSSGGASGSKGTEKNEYESSPSKRTRPSEPKDVHEILDEREGSKMPYSKLERHVLEQALQNKIDAFNQLQTEKNLKQKAGEKNSNRAKASGLSSSRLKPGNEYRTTSKKEESVFGASRSYEKSQGVSKEEKSRLSPATRLSINSGGESAQSKTRFLENKSPPAAPYHGFLTASSLPANHGLSNSYEQATFAMQGISPFIVPQYLPHGIVMNPLMASAQFHNAMASRSQDTKRELSRSSSTTTTTTTTSERSRTRDEDVERDYSSQTKKDIASSKNNFSGSPSPKPDVDKERGRERPRRTNENDEEKQRAQRDNPSHHGSQGLPSNLAFGRGNMSAIGSPHFSQGFPRMMYSPAQGDYRTPFEHPYNPYPRK